MYCCPHPEEPRHLARRLEGWPQTHGLAAILRDAREERAPQDEVGDCFSSSQDEVRGATDMIRTSETPYQGDTHEPRSDDIGRTSPHSHPRSCRSGIFRPNG